MTVDIFGIISAIIVPLFVAYMRAQKSRDSETLSAISGQNAILDRMTRLLNGMIESHVYQRESIKAIIEDDKQIQMKLATMDTKIDTTAHSVNDIHRRLDR